MEEQRVSFLSCLFVCFFVRFASVQRKEAQNNLPVSLRTGCQVERGEKERSLEEKKGTFFSPPGHALFCPARLKYTFFTQGNKFILQFFFAISIVWDILKQVKLCIFGLLGY